MAREPLHSASRASASFRAGRGNPQFGFESGRHAVDLWPVKAWHIGYVSDAGSDKATSL